MFLAFNSNYIACRICGEMNESSQTRCQNCRLNLLSRNNRTHRNNIVVNPLNLNIDNIIPNDNFNIKKEIYRNPVTENLEVKTINFSLYNKGKNGKLEPKICCICLDKMEYGQQIYLLSCNHGYHRYCLIKWIRQKSDCPYCRKQFKFIKK